MARDVSGSPARRPQETLSGSSDDDTSFAEASRRVDLEDSKLDLEFVAHEWLLYGPKRGGHRNLDLAQLAYCFVEFFAKRVDTAGDWASVFDRERISEEMKDEVNFNLVVVTVFVSIMILIEDPIITLQIMRYYWKVSNDDDPRENAKLQKWFLKYVQKSKILADGTLDSTSYSMMRNHLVSYLCPAVKSTSKAGLLNVTAALAVKLFGKNKSFDLQTFH